MKQVVVEQLYVVATIMDTQGVPVTVEKKQSTAWIWIPIPLSHPMYVYNNKSA